MSEQYHNSHNAYEISYKRGNYKNLFFLLWERHKYTDLGGVVHEIGKNFLTPSGERSGILIRMKSQQNKIILTFYHLTSEYSHLKIKRLINPILDLEDVINPIIEKYHSQAYWTAR